MAATKKTEGGIDEMLSNLSREGVEALSRIWAKNDEETLKMGLELKRMARAEAEAAAKDEAQAAGREEGE